MRIIVRCEKIASHLPAQLYEHNLFCFKFYFMDTLQQLRCITSGRECVDVQRRILIVCQLMYKKEY